jgi:beta-lactamase class A
VAGPKDRSRSALSRSLSSWPSAAPIRNRIKALLPFGTPVEHKTGTLNGLSDDVGFITMPDGHRVAVAIFTRGGSNRPRTIAEAARAIYDGFKSVFSWPFTPAVAAQ